MPSKQVPLVGVTGGIGSGKSAVCSCFEKLGRVVLSADRIARELTEHNPGVRKSLSEKFGPGIFGPDGSLLRGELARIVFAQPAKLRALNAIVHPLVFTSLNDALARLPSGAGSPYAIVEAALVFESGMDRRLDATVVVKASEEVRIERVLLRDGLARDAVIARMRAQMSQEETVKRADFIIENNGPEQDLRERVKFIDRVLTLHFR
jgi:dephospho-CoA kinase